MDVAEIIAMIFVVPFLFSLLSFFLRYVRQPLFLSSTVNSPTNAYTLCLSVVLLGLLSSLFLSLFLTHT